MDYIWDEKLQVYIPDIEMPEIKFSGKYARMAFEYMQEEQPTMFEKLVMLGEMQELLDGIQKEAVEQILSLTSAPLIFPEDMPFMERVGISNMRQLEAESQVIREFVLQPHYA